MTSRTPPDGGLNRHHRNWKSRRPPQELRSNDAHYYHQAWRGRNGSVNRFTHWHSSIIRHESQQELCLGAASRQSARVACAEAAHGNDVVQVRMLMGDAGYLQDRLHSGTSHLEHTVLEHTVDGRNPASLFYRSPSLPNPESEYWFPRTGGKGMCASDPNPASGTRFVHIEIEWAPFNVPCSIFRRTDPQK